MTKKQRAIISWVPTESGGRRSPFVGPKYSTLARFEEDRQLAMGAWSLVVEFIHVFQNPRHVLAEVQFLSDEAPDQLLHDGSRFELLEGNKCTAKGIVLPSAVEVPREISAFEAALIG
ncbi:MAG TPA: hypothetical protein VFE47_16110 [Tepidisphaeraceae bacterium]|jgi:hypothetical protein|nr:hypothetical protein [Tepidisphaeraceae bacterium]